MWPKTFREKFCDRFGCPPEAFERRVFWRCLHRRTLPLALIVYLIHRQHFAHDLQTIRQAGLCRSPEEFRSELEAFHYESRMRGGLLRNLKVRLSGRRLMDLGRQLEQPLAQTLPQRLIKSA